MANSSRIDRSSSTTRMRGGRRSGAVSARWAALLMSSSCRDRGARRQAHGDARTNALLRVHANLTVVVGDDAMDNGEAQTAALGKTAVERLKEAFQLGSGNADPLVLDRQRDVFRHRLDRPGETEPATVGHRAEAIGRQVPDDLLYLSFVGFVPELVRGYVEDDLVAILHLGAVAQQERRVVQGPAHVESLDLKPLRPRVRQKRSDRRVEAFRFAQHDVHQLLLLGAQRQLLPQDLNRARHRGQGITNLVRDTSGHLADRGQALLDGGVPLQFLEARDVLKGEEKPRAPARSLEVRSTQADLDIAAAVWRSEPELVAPGARLAQPVMNGIVHWRGEAHHLADRTPDGGLKWHAGNHLSRAIERQDPVGLIRRGQPAG